MWPLLPSARCGGRLMRVAIIVAATVISAAWVLTNRFVVFGPADNPIVVRVDQITGQVSYCRPTDGVRGEPLCSPWAD